VTRHTWALGLLLLASLPAAVTRADSLDPIFLNSKTDSSKTGETQPGPAPDEARKQPVQVDKEHSRVIITGRFTGSVGLLELGACARRGKVFLSVLVLDARPSAIAEAMGSLGVKPGTVPAADPKARTASAPTGRGITCVVEWQARMKDKVLDRRERLESFFWHRASGKVLPESPWIYAGSTRVRDEETESELFVADLSGSVATITRFDTSALLYYGGLLPLGQVWSANPDRKPAAGTPCRLILEPAPVPKPPEQPTETPGPEQPKDYRDSEPAPDSQPGADAGGAKSDAGSSPPRPVPADTEQ